MTGNPLRLTTVFVGVVAVGLLVGWLIRSQPTETVAVGRPAPDFTVELLEGGEFSLSDHLDGATGPMVLNLWASWCVPCRLEMPEIDEFAANNPGVMVLGVAVQDAFADAIAFAEDVAVDYPLAFGNPAFDAAYPRIALPVTYVINASGTVTVLHNGILDASDLEALVRR